MAYILQRRALKGLVQQQLDQMPKRQDSEFSSGASTPLTDNKTLAFPIDDLYLSIPGITSEIDKNGQPYYNVGWVDETDKFNPRLWPFWTRLMTTMLVCLIALLATIASSIDSAISARAAAEFGVDDIVESLATGLFLIAFGAGSLLASPLSELIGRQPVYLYSLFIFAAWTVGAGLAPNIAAHLIFRFLMGLSASAPLTVAGGTVSDLWSPLERTFALPCYAIPGFGGAVLGPVIGAYIGSESATITWRWSEWLVLIATGALIVVLFFSMRETFAPRILYLKADTFRASTGDARFKTSIEAHGDTSTQAILKRSFMRPFLLCFEPIVVAATLYMTIAYIIMFTFLDGYPMIFGEVYDIGVPLSNICFLGLLVGIMLSVGLLPLIYSWTASQLKHSSEKATASLPNREARLYFAMIGAPFLPVGLFWMGWTDYAHISIWSPLVASVLVGFGIICIFMSANLYIIDSYEMYAASALTFNALVRYLGAGCMTVGGIPMYKTLGNHWTLTVLGIISTLVVPLPYLAFKWGPSLRARSKWAHN